MLHLCFLQLWRTHLFIRTFLQTMRAVLLVSRGYMFSTRIWSQIGLLFRQLFFCCLKSYNPLTSLEIKPIQATLDTKIRMKQLFFLHNLSASNNELSEFMLILLSVIKSIQFLILSGGCKSLGPLSQLHFSRYCWISGFGKKPFFHVLVMCICEYPSISKYFDCLTLFHTALGRLGLH